MSSIKGEKMMIGLAQEHDVHPNQIKQWREQFLEAPSGVFVAPVKTVLEPSAEVKALPVKIKKRMLDNDFYPVRPAR